MKKEKLLTKTEFAKEIGKMVYGDVFDISFRKTDEATIIDGGVITNFSKTFWLDTTTYLLGGVTDTVYALRDKTWDKDWKEIDVPFEEIAEKIWETYKYDDTVKVVIDYKYKVIIHEKGAQVLPKVEYGKLYDNRVYER